MRHIIISQLARAFEANHQQQFTGIIRASSREGQIWQIYFLHGRLIWANGGLHRFRRWQRLLTQASPHVDERSNYSHNQVISVFWEYQTLVELIKQEDMTRDQAIELIQQMIAEILFDILQSADKFEQSISTAEQIKSLGNPVILFNPQEQFQSAEQSWNDWSAAGLSSFSPNLAPVLKDREALQRAISLKTYSRLSNLISGELTLRELAAKMKVSPLLLMRSLLPHVLKGSILLHPLPDSQHSTRSGDATPMGGTSGTSDRSTQPLVVCIDDSPSIGRTMERIVTQLGYRFLYVQDPLQAIPLLLEAKPQLIFLDLVMPVANGYEICAQIRRISAFKSTPIVILTGNDGIVDRVRAKIVGASDFLSKPVQVAKVLDVARRYLMQSADPGPSQSHQSYTTAAPSNLGGTNALLT